MSTPIHKRCYRCNRSLPEFVDNRDSIGGEHGVCPDCNLTLGAQEVARKWHLLHPELPCAPIAEAIPREISPVQSEPVVNQPENKNHHA